jgi:lipopolysaccharide export system protein LptC
MSAPKNRFRLVMIIVTLLALALGSFWVLEVQRRNIAETASPIPKGEPDYTIENFNFVKMSKTGQIRYDISGVKLTHYPDNDTFNIQQPVVHNLENNSAPITMRSEQAIVDNIHNIIHMYRNVQIDRPATASEQQFHLSSEYLMVLPDEDIMKTDKPVHITFGGAQLDGVGMYANNATREFRLANTVRGTYPPAPR